MCFHEVKLEDKYGSENMITRGDRSLAEWKTSIRWLVFGFLHCINGFGLGTYICCPFLTVVAIVFVLTRRFPVLVRRGSSTQSLWRS